ncbi:SDR family NAD(P)-dependent oxidoreductase [Cesiribacter sp. SM1]|uniref:SDR family NAD(P)-dependent oxidoreductase n=1 Tax=Cesiribacter sp. SM1 TaxID=2861196 RepID=UPI001CD45348|nr:SDR family NAD(P)-dependent oxidoreductase [Cesiribacter sp. SM1]
MIFVTGASGLIGTHLVRRLIAEGYKVRALRRANSNISQLEDISAEIDWVEADLLDVSQLHQLLKGCRQVIHCAGMVSFAAKDKDLLYQTNVEGTTALVNSSLAAGIERFIHISSVAAIGRSRRTSVVDEKQKWEKSSLNSWYGETKYLGELEVWRAHTEGMPCIIFNPSTVLGPGPLHRSSTQLFNYVIKKNRFYPPGLMNWVDVRDVVDLTMAALQPTATTGQRYIISAGAVRYELLFRQMADCLGVPPPQIKANSVLTSGAYYLEKIRSRFQQKSPLITKETVKLSNLEIEFNNSKTRKEFNHTFRSLHETIQWCCKELQSYML